MNAKRRKTKGERRRRFRLSAFGVRRSVVGLGMIGVAMIGCQPPGGALNGNSNGPPLGTADGLVATSLCGQVATECVPLSGSEPRDVVAADFDADGDMDLAVTNFGSANLSVLLNDGAGRFEEADRISIGVRPRSLFTVESDGGERTNLVLLSFASSTEFSSMRVTWLLNDGGASFAVASQSLDFGSVFGTNPVHNAMTLGDFDGDGDLDFATSDFVLFTNDGDETLQPGVALPQPPDFDRFAVNIASEDLDGDGDIDLVLVDAASGSLFLLTNDGQASFTLAEFPLFAPAEVIRLATADVDGDGLDELIAVRARVPAVSSDPGDVFIVRRRADGALASAEQLSAGEGPHFVVPADMNGDGLSDLVVTNRNSNDVSVLLNLGDAVFASALTASLAGSPNAPAVSDFDDDGDPDVAVAIRDLNSIAILLNDGSGSLVVVDPG